MSWGTELWDQYDNLAIHTQKGIDFLERYGHFIRDRCHIEKEYAAKLRRLVKNYQPKKKEEDEYQYSPCQAFKLVMNEVNDLAGQHEVVAENLQANVIEELSILTKDIKEERKKHLNEGAKLTQMLTNQIISLERARKAYEKAFKESEKALENFHKADADLNLSRAEIEKHKQTMSIKSQICEDAKNEYASQLQKTNEMQRTHYQTNLPLVLGQLQELDEKRIKNIKSFIHNSADIEKKVSPIISQCLEGISKAADYINEKEDTMLVIERYKSGFQPPEDFPFEDLSRGGGGDMGSGNIHTMPGAPSALRESMLTVKGTMSAGKLKKRVGIFGIFGSNKNATGLDGKDDYSELPPNQRRKKLQAKVEELELKVSQEAAARDGLMKMKGVYEANPALGDPMTIEGQLNESSHKLEKLRTELSRYKGYLADAQKVINGNGSSGGSQHASPHTARSSMNGKHTSMTNGSARSSGSGADDNSLSRSESDSSVTNPTVNHNKVNTNEASRLNEGSSHSPESGLGTSHTSLPGIDSDQDQHDGEEGEYYEAERLPALGTCRALYPFDATSEGSIPMTENEELYVIELDQGDGWTRVRRTDSLGEEGFVPTTYIEIALSQ